MVDRVEVDPDQLETAARFTQDVADQVHAVGGRLRERLGSLENDSNKQPWGNDSMGEKFINGQNNDGYGTSKPNLLDGVDGIGDTFESFAVGQRDAVGQLRTMDSQF